MRTRTADHLVVSVLAGISAVLLVPIIESAAKLPFRPSAFHVMLGVVALVVLENIGLSVARLLARRWSFFGRVGRFAATGVFNTALDTSLLATLAKLAGVYDGVVLAFFNIVSYSITLTISYFINRSWSFGTEKDPHIGEFTAFAAVGVGNLILGTAFVYILTTLVGPPHGFSPSQWVTIVKIMSVAISFLWNFSWLHLVIFKRRPTAS